MDLALLAQAAPPQLVLDQERHLQRRGRALVGHRRDADDDPPAGERVERGPQPLRCIGPVEVMRLGLEVLDRLGQDAGARCEDELVVVQAATVLQLDQLFASSTRCTRPTSRRTSASSSVHSGRTRFSATSLPMAMYMNPGW